MLNLFYREEKAAAAAKSGSSGEASDAVATLGNAPPPTATSMPGVNQYTGISIFLSFFIFFYFSLSIYNQPNDIFESSKRFFA